MKTSTLLALHTAAVAALLTAAGCASVQPRGHGSLFGKTDPNQTEGDIIQPGQTVTVQKSEAQTPKAEVQTPKAEVQAPAAETPKPDAPKAATEAPNADAKAPAKDIRPVSDVGRPGTYPEFIGVPDGLQGRKGVLAAQVNAEGKKFPKPTSDSKPVVVGQAPTGPAVPKVKTVHVVQSGETLGHIAQKYKVPRSEILKVNSMGDPNRIRVGQKINIPEYDASKAPQRPAAGSATKTVTAPEGGSVHVVQKGEMVGGIAHKYGLKAGDVLRANGLTEETAKKIHVGQQLIIPAKTDANTYTPSKDASSRPAPVKEEAAATAPVVAPQSAVTVPAAPVPAAEPKPAATVPAAPAAVVPVVPTVQPTVPGAAAAPTGAVKTYVVQPGDDLVTIASRFKTSKITLIQLNNMTLYDTLQPGTTIRVP